MTFIPGVHPTYKEQFDKLTAAYINNEVDPYLPCACFVGNLLNRADNWIDGRTSEFKPIENIAPENTYTLMHTKRAFEEIKQESRGLYSPADIYDLEENFLRRIAKDSFQLYDYAIVSSRNPDYENALFSAFESTLEMLRALHIQKGEQVDPKPEFKKRKQTV